MILVDTCVWIYLFDKKAKDKHSIAVKEFYQSNNDILVITDLIIEETHKWLIHHRFPPNNASSILNNFVSQEFAQIIPIEDQDRIEASKSVEKYLDQQLSYTDAVSVAIMKRNHIKKIFSFDTDFDLFRGIERIP